MTETSDLLKAIQDIQSSLTVLPDIQVQIAKLTEAISTLLPQEGKDRNPPKRVTNGISGFPMSPTLTPMVETMGSINEPINDLSNKQLSEKDIKIISNEHSVESGDKSKKRMSVAERKKSRRARKKLITTQSQGESSSNEAEIEQKSAPEIQPKKIQEQEHALIREEVIPTQPEPQQQPPSRAQARNKINRITYRNDSREQSDRRFGNVYPRETLKDNYNLSVSTFEEMKLRPELLRGIRALGYDQPTSIQKRAIKAILTRRDVIIQVPRSEERTLTYLIGLLQHVDPRDTSCQGIVLVHSKDLCFAIQDLIEEITKHRQISWSVCVGGYPVRQDVEKLRSVRQQIIIGTP
ncbi:3981_t:CDS:2, partial [Scutellospora calospora]